jgi:hypothetical protein
LDANNGAITAIATFVMALFTIVLAFVSWWQAKLIGRQVALGREEFATTARAFVFIDGFNTVLFTLEDQEGPGEVDLSDAVQPKHGPKKLEKRLFPTYFSIQPRWRNAGSTPTKNMTTKVNWRPLEVALGPDFDFAYTDRAERHFLGPKSIETSTFVEIPAIHATKAIAFKCGMPLISSVGTNEYAAIYPSIVIWGRADYLDIFDKPHFIEWCYRTEFSCPDGKKLSASFTQCGEYNRTDEDGA